MDWTPGDISNDIEDRRDNSGSGGGGFSGGGIGLIGVVLLLILSLVTGHNFLGSILSGSQQSQSQSYQATGQHPTSPRPHPAGEDEDVHLISFVLNDAQQTWTQIFADAGKPYRHAKLVLYRRSTYSGCGTAQATTGPFYCPEDEKIYIDLSFWDELKRFGGSITAFAQAYVITHELGHHIQKLLGIEGREARLAQQDPDDRNPLSVALELQADCFAGVWAASAEKRGIVTPSDIPAALSAAAAVGDDHLQQMSGRAVSPESWTHGSSAQREHWFRAGLTGGNLHACTTFHGSLAPQ